MRLRMRGSVVKFISGFKANNFLLTNKNKKIILLGMIRGAWNWIYCSLGIYCCRFFALFNRKIEVDLGQNSRVKEWIAGSQDFSPLDVKQDLRKRSCSFLSVLQGLACLKNGKDLLKNDLGVDWWMQKMEQMEQQCPIDVDKGGSALRCAAFMGKMQFSDATKETKETIKAKVDDLRTRLVKEEAVATFSIDATDGFKKMRAGLLPHHTMTIVSGAEVEGQKGFLLLDPIPRGEPKIENDKLFFRNGATRYFFLTDEEMATHISEVVVFSPTSARGLPSDSKCL